ncbi:hypothetical protein PS15p_212318 [Mucor circinelloides]
MLIDESKRILANYRAEFESLQEAIFTTSPPSYFIYNKFLEVEYRYKIATSLLSEIAKAQPPCINHRRHKQFYNIFVVEFPEQTIIPDITDEEIEAGIIDPFVYLEDIEGGELNPEEQKQFTIDEFLLDE